MGSSLDGGVTAARFTLVSPARAPPRAAASRNARADVIRAGRPPSGRRGRAPPSRAFLRQGIPAPARGPVETRDASARRRRSSSGPAPARAGLGWGCEHGVPTPAGGAGRGGGQPSPRSPRPPSVPLRELTLHESQVPSQRDAWVSCPGGVSGGSPPAACMPTPPGAGSCVAGARCGLAWPWPALGRAGKPWPDSPGPVRSVWGGAEDVQPGPTRPGALACGRGAMTLSLFTVSPPVWELITVRTRRDGWKDEQIAVCL